MGYPLLSPGTNLRFVVLRTDIKFEKKYFSFSQ